MLRTTSTLLLLPAVVVASVATQPKAEETTRYDQDEGREWSNLDSGMHADAHGNCFVQGWVSGADYSGPALPVQLAVDNETVVTTVANISRKVAGKHGFNVPLPCAKVSFGLHRIHAFAPPLTVDADGADFVELKNSPMCVTDGTYNPTCTPSPPGIV